MAYAYTTLTTTGKAAIIKAQIQRFESEHYQHELNISCVAAQLTAGSMTQAEYDTMVASSTAAIATLVVVLTELTTQTAALEAL